MSNHLKIVILVICMITMNTQNSDIIRYLMSPWNGDKGLIREIEDYAKHLGWYPSDIIEEKRKDSITTGHLFVEHGLDNSAVISFINNKFLYKSLTEGSKQNLLGISYNNLVDLHISVDRLYVTGVHNRMNYNNLIHTGNTEDEYNLKSSTYSDIFQERKIRPELKSLDNALIETISYWKRIIASELGNKVDNEQLSIFFNSIIFLRAFEDYHYNKNLGTSYKNGLNIILEDKKVEKYIDVIRNFIEKYQTPQIPRTIIDTEKLLPFNSLNKRVLSLLFEDFYRNKYTQYDYDFSIMSKHALSRIYEKYITLLEVKPSPQLSIFTPVPDEQINKNTGSFYTPQFIARFFTRFLEQNIDGLFAKNLRILEPAVGSGIFIRTFLERQIEVSKTTNNIFKNIVAVDLNPTACNAANLSLSLLHLINYDQFPTAGLEIYAENSMDFFSGNKHKAEYDIIISNPPFKKYNILSEGERNQLKSFLGEYSFGKTDLYAAFIRIAIDSLKNEGIACFVLPNTFLITDSAKKIRAELHNSFNIMCIVDISDYKQKVFEDADVYPILIIFKKTKVKTNAIIAKIQENTGKALYHILNQEFITNNSFSIYSVPHSFFSEESWFLLPPTEFSIKEKISKNPKLENFFDVRTGFASGDVSAFIFPKKTIPKGEESIFVPYLGDREMTPYITSKEVSEYFFHPYHSNDKITEETLSTKYPNTYKHIKKYEPKLKERNEVKKGRLEWWMPNRPRSPKFMLVPKILTPHLVFSPKFNLDMDGRYAISRSPFLVPKKEFEDIDFLYYFVGILNSSICFWHLLLHAPKYQKGFAMLEPTYLKGLPVPSPLSENTSHMLLVQKVISLVKQRMICKENERITIEKNIDSLVAELYNLNSTEIEFLSI